jgi:hypothetical protein
MKEVSKYYVFPSVHNPSDPNTGLLRGTRQHSPMLLEKEFDNSSPCLYRAVASGLPLKTAELKWYRIDDAGKEREYFIMHMENVRIVSVAPIPRIREMLQHIGETLGRDIRITSGDRGSIVKGSSTKSLHLIHEAADFHVVGLSDAEAFRMIRNQRTAIFGTERGEAYRW